MKAKDVVSQFLKLAAVAEYPELEMRAKMRSAGYNDEEINKFLNFAGARKGTLVNTREILGLPKDDPRKEMAVRFTKVQRVFEFLS